MNFHLSLVRPLQELRELNLLQELEKNPVCSQRELSNKFGFALGVTNACLKKMVQRGWIRVKDIDHRRIGYHLTPKGVAEKAKLNHDLISWSLEHYTVLRNVIGQRLQEMKAYGVKRVVVLSSSYVYGALADNPYYVDEDYPRVAFTRAPSPRGRRA